MRPPSPPTQADQVLPAPKPFLTQDQLDEIWDTRGFKYLADELHISLLNHGLIVAIDRKAFRGTIYNLLKKALVDGLAKLDPKKMPLPKFPKVY